MNVTVQKTFTKDALKLPGFAQQRIALLIEELEKRTTLSEMSNCKNVQAAKKLTTYTT